MKTSQSSPIKKRQQTVLQQPRLAHRATLLLPNHANRAALTVTEIFMSPPDLPNLNTAMKNVNICIRTALSILPSATGHMKLLLEGVQIYLEQEQIDSPQPMSLAGRKQIFLEWDLITTKLEKYHVKVHAIIGFELMQAYLQQTKFDRSLSVRLNKITKEEKYINNDQEWISKKFTQKLTEINKTVESMARGLTTTQAHLNIIFNAYLMVQFNSLNVMGRQAAGRRNELLESDCLILLAELREKVEHGDFIAALRCTAFCMGLSRPLAEKVPVVLDEKCTAVIQIRVDLGTHYCNLGAPLSGLANSGPVNSVCALKELHRPFPEFLAGYWRKALSNNPVINVVLDAQVKNRTKYVSRIDDTVISAGIHVTESRLINSRGAIFLHAGIQRDTAAIAALDPCLIDKADLHYIYKSPEEIWTACNQVFQYVGWGNAVRRPDAVTAAVGTKKSPETNTVLQKVSTLRDDLNSSRAGKKYTLQSIANAHNSFVNYVAFMMMFTLGGRHRVIVNYKANAWKPNNPFGVHIDKPGSVNQSRLQSPLPPYLQQTLCYLYTHYRKLDDRLEKRRIDKSQPVRVWIKSILSGECVNLLFKFDKNSLPCDLLLSDVILKTDALSGDTFRHYLPNALESAGVPFDYVQAWLKHHAAGSSANSVTNRTPPVVWLSSVATGLSDIALRLGLIACHGIAKG
jgi:hypothetical protein